MLTVGSMRMFALVNFQISTTVDSKLSYTTFLNLKLWIEI
jgi:hypothetical protein